MKFLPEFADRKVAPARPDGTHGFELARAKRITCKALRHRLGERDVAGTLRQTAPL